MTYGSVITFYGLVLSLAFIIAKVGTNYATSQWQVAAKRRGDKSLRLYRSGD